MTSRVLSRLGSKAVRPFAGAAAFVAFAASTIAAQIIVPDVQWPETSAYYARAITRGTTEAKRDVLHKIRNHRSERASELAIPALTDADPIVRATAAAAIIWLPRERATAILIPMLRDRDEFVRREAAYALGIVGTPDAVSDISRVLLSDRVLEVRSAAAVALGGIGDASGIPALMSVLDLKRSDENEFLRSMAARSVGQIAVYIRSGERIEVFPRNFLPAKYKLSLREKPAASVDSTVSQLLLKILRDGKEHIDLRRHAAFALGAIGYPSLESDLRPFTESPDPYLAEIAREALLMLGADTAEN